MIYVSNYLKNLLVFAALILIGYLLFFASYSFSLKILLVGLVLYTLAIIFLALIISLIEKDFRYLLFLPIVAIGFQVSYAIFSLLEIVGSFINKLTRRIRTNWIYLLSVLLRKSCHSLCFSKTLVSLIILRYIFWYIFKTTKSPTLKR